MLADKRLLCAWVIALAASVVAAGPATARRAPASIYAPANGCFALQAASNGRFVTTAGATGYAASASSRAGALPLRMQPTALGRYMLYDAQMQLLVAAGGAHLGRSLTPGPAAEFALADAHPGGTFTLRSTHAHRYLTTGSAGALTLSSRAAAWNLVSRSGCQRFPEAAVGAVVHGPGTRVEHGHIFGFVDDHVHITGNRRAGGDVISGEPYDPFGITVALGRDAQVHGTDGVAGHHRQPAARRQPHRQPRHPRLADVQGVADVQLDDPPTGVLRVARASVAGGDADGRRPDGGRRAAVRDRGPEGGQDVL